MHLVARIGLAAIGLTLGLSGTLARADVVAVVSSQSPVMALNKSQVMDIFFCRRTRFPDGSPAVPIDQVEGSEVRDEFYVRFANMSAAQIKAFWSKIIFTGRGEPPRAVANSMEAKKLVVANPNVITYIDRSLVDGSVRVVFGP